MSHYLKDPAASLDYSIDWAGQYLAAGESITQSQWSITPDEPGGLVSVGEALNAGLTMITLAGGIAGHSYHVTNKVTLSNGLIDERSLVILVDQR